MKNLFITTGLILSLVFVPSAQSQPKEILDPKEKCPVCGMFVSKYPEWVVQLHLSNGEVIMFDGVKDMLKYYFEPDKYGLRPKIKTKIIYVKDYYTQNWINGYKAYYVKGSDVTGPMGHEFIPFSSEDAATSFKKDHHGKSVMTFEDINFEDLKDM